MWSANIVIIATCRKKYSLSIGKGSKKGYARPYEADNRPLYKIGVSFSSETGTVSDWKVK